MEQTRLRPGAKTKLYSRGTKYALLARISRHGVAISSQAGIAPRSARLGSWRLGAIIKLSPRGRRATSTGRALGRYSSTAMTPPPPTCSRDAWKQSSSRLDRVTRFAAKNRSLALVVQQCERAPGSWLFIIRRASRATSESCQAVPEIFPGGNKRARD